MQLKLNKLNFLCNNAFSKPQETKKIRNWPIFKQGPPKPDHRLPEPYLKESIQKSPNWCTETMFIDWLRNKSLYYIKWQNMHLQKFCAIYY